MSQQPDFYSDPLLGLHDLEITEPDEPEKSIYEEFLEFADLKELMETVRKMDLLDNMKSALAKELLEKARIDRIEYEMKRDPEPPWYQGYDTVTFKYRKMFEKIQERARVRLAHMEDTAWEVIFSSENSQQSGQQKRIYILKNKDRYFIPGVWSIASKLVNENGKFKESQTIVKYLADAPKNDPDSILIVSNPPGRPKAK